MTTINQLLDSIPLVLAGPIVRRATPAGVSFWVATSKEVQCTVRVWRDRTSHSGSAYSMEFGRHIHICLVTVEASRTFLQEGALFEYDVTFRELSDSRERSLMDAGVLLPSSSRSPVTLGYGPVGTLPSFFMPPSNYTQLRIAHASCRSTTGQGLDALADLGMWMDRHANSSEFRTRRPHILLLTGDQIYADSMNRVVGSYAYRVARTLAGAEEAFFSPSDDEQLTSASSSDMRARLAGNYCGITASSKSGHALRFTEYLLLHFLSWSPTLWPSQPNADLTQFLWNVGAGLSPTDRHEIQRALQFRDGLAHVRKLLANVSTLMSFDDHEISDDWNMDKQWLDESVFSPNPTVRACSRRYQANGLLAFAICQHWGNDPQAFGHRTHGGELLSAAQQWTRRGYLATERSSWDQYVGLPDPTIYQRHGRLQPESANALRWSYRIHDASWNYDILSIDGRTRRTFGWMVLPSFTPSREIDLDLLNPSAPQSVLPSPASSLDVSFIVVSQPVLNLPILRDIKLSASQHPALVGVATIRSEDLSEGWDLDPIGTSRLLLFAAARQPRRATVLISGDVHYAYTARVSLQYSRLPTDATRTTPPRAALVVQCVSSGARNEDANTVSLHNNNNPFSSVRTAQLDWILQDDRGAGPIPPRISTGYPQWVFGVEPSSLDSVWNALHLEALSPLLQQYPRSVLTDKTTSRPGIVLVALNRFDSTNWLRIAREVDWYWRSDILRGQRMDRPTSSGTLQPGEIIVGYNNVGFISFAGNSERPILRHELFFGSAGTSGDFRTRFDVLLNPADPDFPVSPLPFSPRV